MSRSNPDPPALVPDFDHLDIEPDPDQIPATLIDREHRRRIGEPDRTSRRGRWPGPDVLRGLASVYLFGLGCWLTVACASTSQPRPTARPPADPVACAAAQARAVETCARTPDPGTPSARAPECVAATAAGVTACLPAPAVRPEGA